MSDSDADSLLSDVSEPVFDDSDKEDNDILPGEVSDDGDDVGELISSDDESDASETSSKKSTTEKRVTNTTKKPEATSAAAASSAAAPSALKKNLKPNPSTMEERLGRRPTRERLTKMHLSDKEGAKKATDLVAIDLGNVQTLPLVKSYDTSKDYEWIEAAAQTTVFEKFVESGEYKEVHGKFDHQIIQGNKKLWYIQANDDKIIEELAGKSFSLRDLEQRFELNKAGDARCHMVMVPNKTKWTTREMHDYLTLVPRQRTMRIPDVDASMLQRVGVGSIFGAHTTATAASSTTKAKTSAKLVSPKSPIGSGPAKALRAEKVRSEPLVVNGGNAQKTKMSQPAKSAVKTNGNSKQKPEKQKDKKASSTKKSKSSKHDEKSSREQKRGNTKSKDHKRKRKDSESSSKRKKAKHS